MKAGRSFRGLMLVLALALIVGVAGGATFAWLTAKTDPVVNTFTYGDINIDLAESTGSDYKIIPGVDIGKDPKVTVKAGSEACWLFVKVEEEKWPELTYVNKDGKAVRKVNYDIADGWTKGDETNNIPANVYYRVVDASKANQEFPVIHFINQLPIFLQPYPGGEAAKAASSPGGIAACMRAPVRGRRHMPCGKRKTEKSFARHVRAE